MKPMTGQQSRRSGQRPVKQRVKPHRPRRARPHARPAAAYRQRGMGGAPQAEAFNAPEIWHESQDDANALKIVVQPPGRRSIHPLTPDDVRQRIETLPKRFTRNLGVIQFSRMTRKRALFPCYGMQWGPNIYLYPIEESLVESYVQPPRPQDLIEARMYGGEWYQDGKLWRLKWTSETIRDFYLNNVLIHEIGHVNDDRNASFNAREQYANWFAIEYGYRASRSRR